MICRAGLPCCFTLLILAVFLARPYSFIHDNFIVPSSVHYILLSFFTSFEHWLIFVCTCCQHVLWGGCTVGKPAATVSCSFGYWNQSFEVCEGVCLSVCLSVLCRRATRQLLRLCRTGNCSGLPLQTRFFRSVNSTTRCRIDIFSATSVLAIHSPICIYIYVCIYVYTYVIIINLPALLSLFF